MTTRTSAPRAKSAAAAQEVRNRRVSRAIAIVGAALVTVVAAYVSYFHIVEWAATHDQSQSSAHMIPFAIDGLMIVAAVAMVANRHAWLPKIAFGVEALLTLSANMLSVHHPDPLAYVVAVTPAVALLLLPKLLLQLCMPAAPKRRRATKPKTAGKSAPRAVRGARPAVARTPQPVAA